MANQTRVVLDEAERPKAEQILEQTGIKTFSQLFSRPLAKVAAEVSWGLKLCDRSPLLIRIAYSNWSKS